MRPLYLLARLALLPPFIFGTLACSPTSSSIVKASSPGIFQGSEVKLDQPVQRSVLKIQIKTPTMTSACTGSVLSSVLVLTAAHCVDDSSISEINVLLQDNSFQKVKTKLIHPGYMADHKTVEDFTLFEGYDLALLKLEMPLPESYRPVFLGSDFGSSLAQSLQIAGYGRQSTEVDDAADGRLYAGKIEMDWLDLARVLNLSETVTLKISPANSEHSRLLQFRKTSATAGFCKGDSGGPVFFEKEGRIFQLGVISSLASERACAENSDQTQYAAALTYSALKFIEAGAITLGNPSLLISTELMNPKNSFEYYFSRVDGPEFNQSLDLRNKTLVIDTYTKDDKEFAKLVNVSGPRSACVGAVNSFVDFNARLSPFASDGTKPVLARALSVQNKKLNLDHTYEARIKHINGKYQFVVLTPHGFVTKTFAIAEKCTF